MTKVIIDNSTISSSMRALGIIESPNKDILDIEQASLNRLTEAILLSDEILIPDNYKDEFKNERKAWLKDGLFNFQAIPSKTDQDLTKISQSLSGVWAMAYKDGSQNDLFAQYLGQAQAMASFFWEHSSSEFFLVFRALGIGKTSPLIEAILASKGDYGLAPNLKIADKNGRLVKYEALAKHVQRMLSVFGWLGNQYIWYQLFATQHDAYYLPHPLRDFFAHDFLFRINKSKESPDEFAKVFHLGISNYSEAVSAQYERLQLKKESYGLKLPVFLPMLAKHCPTGSHYLDFILKLRSTSSVVELRKKLKEIEVDLFVGRVDRYAGTLREIEIIGKNILLEKGIEASYINVGAPLEVLGIKFSGDDAKVKLPIPKALFKQYFATKKYRAFMKSVMDDLTVPPTLGSYKDKLDSWAKVKPDKYPPFYLNGIPNKSLFAKPFKTSTRPKLK